MIKLQMSNLATVLVLDASVRRVCSGGSLRQINNAITVTVSVHYCAILKNTRDQIVHMVHFKASHNLDWHLGRFLNNHLINIPPAVVSSSSICR